MGMAAERARSIASGVPFILPVVIDDTREPDALVPDRFRAVQWTRLPGGVVPPEVQARFLKLWSHRTGVLKHEAVSGGQTTEDRGRKTEDGANQSRRRKRNPAVIAYRDSRDSLADRSDRRLATVAALRFRPPRPP